MDVWSYILRIKDADHREFAIRYHDCLVRSPNREPFPSDFGVSEIAAGRIRARVFELFYPVAS